MTAFAVGQTKIELCGDGWCVDISNHVSGYELVGERNELFRVRLTLNGSDRIKINGRSMAELFASKADSA